MRMAWHHGGRARRQGYSLIEILIAMVIIAIVALLAGYQANTAMKRARLDAAAENLRSMAQRAPIEMKTRGVTTFLRLEPNIVSGTRANWRATLWADANANGVLDDPGDTLVQTYDAPADILFSTVDANAMETTGWSGTNPSDATSRFLICDALSRTQASDLQPSPTVAQIQLVSRLAITQQDMLPLGAGRLSPTIKYELHIGPVWNPSVSRFRLLDKTATPPTWSPL